jgi:hypothetical protein
MKSPFLLIDDIKTTCGKMDRKTLTAFPQALLLLWWRVPKIGHLYFALTWAHTKWKGYPVGD